MTEACCVEFLRLSMKSSSGISEGEVGEGYSFHPSCPGSQTDWLFYPASQPSPTHRVAIFLQLLRALVATLNL